MSATNTPGHQEDEALGKIYDARLIRRLLGYLRPYRGRVILAILLLLASACIQLAGPWLTRIALDHAIPSGNHRLLTALAGAFFASLVLVFALEYTKTILTTWLGQRVMYDLRLQLFAHLQRQSLSFFDRNAVGRLITRVTNDVEVLNDLFSSGVVTIFGDLFALASIVAAMLLMDWRLTLVSFAVLPLVALVAFFFRARVRTAYRDIRNRLARLNAFLQERLTGMSIVQLFGREQDTVDRFRAIDRDYLEAHLRQITHYALFFPIIELLAAVAFALIIVYGGSQILGGSMTVGVVAAFLQYMRRFFQPIQDLAEKYNMLQSAMAASERIFKLLDTEPELRPPARPVPLPNPGRGEIEFRDVWFAYQRKNGAPAADSASHADHQADGEWDWVLRGLSFRVRPGERVAIVGHTGAGKTSLISLLLRFYEPQRGEILFDGVPIRDVDPEELRRRIGLVLQDVFLFSRDVAYNIRVGDDRIDDERIRVAAERVGADRFIARLPLGYDQPLGERGASLSVGERQLLSFARALAVDPLVLILDEATSSVDSELEQQIEQAVQTLMQGRTSLVIAHRLSTIQNADRILVLHHGELREEGTHQELLARRGLYARLYELQFARAEGPRRASPGVVAGG